MKSYDVIDVDEIFDLTMDEEPEIQFVGKHSPVIDLSIPPKRIDLSKDGPTRQPRRPATSHRVNPRTNSPPPALMYSEMSRVLKTSNTGQRNASKKRIRPHNVSAEAGPSRPYPSHPLSKLSSTMKQESRFSPSSSRKSTLKTELKAELPIDVSDDEPIVLPPTKRVKSSPETDEEEESVVRSQFDFDAIMWQPAEPTAKIEPEAALKRSLVDSDGLPLISRLNISTLPGRTNDHFYSESDPPMWIRLRTAINARRPKNYHPIRKLYNLKILLDKRLPLDRALQKDDMHLITSFKHASGSINRIVQKSGWVGICSASMGGHVDIASDPLNDYNTEGAIMVWRGGSQVLSGHHRELSSGRTKYYTVNDIKFDHCSSKMVSSGNDKSVHIWDYDESTNSYVSLGPLDEFHNAPHELAFKPGESILAVASRDIFIYPELVSPDHGGEPCSRLEVTLKYTSKTKFTTGSIAWGFQSTNGHLFASSEPVKAGSSGEHRAFDVASGTEAYAFDANEAGDAMGVEPSGGYLALVTAKNDDSHILRIYDIARRNGKAISTIMLEPFSLDPPSSNEVNHLSFSPDGILLSLARTDDRTHVYDQRMLGRGVLYDFVHTGPSRVNPNCESYGVVKADWIQTRDHRLGLVSGGGDGCIRLWDPLLAASDKKNGSILAQANSDVGYFSLGDRFEGEYELVIGDCAGEAYVLASGTTESEVESIPTLGPLP